jgi:transcriptional regulator with XRE-family HTH domain
MATERARGIRGELGRELRSNRLDRNLSLADVGRLAGISASQASRIERGLAPSLTIEQACRLGAAVGLAMSARLYPGGSPMRDAAHAALLERLRRRLHPSLAMATEVPLPIPGDLRAFDAVIRGTDWAQPVEAETRPRDAQALDRRIQLKQRDAGFEDVILLLLDSAHDRRFVRSLGSLGSRFTVEGKVALDRLGAGKHPGGSSVILL